MICLKCNTELENDALFCPECGTKQDIRFHCSSCGSILDPNAVYCPECGSNVANSSDSISSPSQSPPPTYEPSVGQPVHSPRNQNGGKVLAIILVVAVLIIGVAAFLLLNPSKKETPKATDSTQKETTKEAEKEKSAADKADIIAVGGETCSLEGIIKTDGSGKKLLTWDEDVSIYGLDDSSQAVLAEKVNNIYINDIGLEDGVLDTVVANKKVVLSGQIYFIGDSIYMKANKISDESGNVLENNQNKNSQTVQTQISYDYIIPYSGNVALSASDVAGLSLQEINYAKNEIYARHGRLFNSPELQNHFNNKRWYNGTINSDAFTDSMLSEIEKNNVTYLKDIEFGINPSGYQLDAR